MRDGLSPGDLTFVLDNIRDLTFVLDNIRESQRVCASGHIHTPSSSTAVAEILSMSIEMSIEGKTARKTLEFYNRTSNQSIIMRNMLEGQSFTCHLCRVTGTELGFQSSEEIHQEAGGCCCSRRVVYYTQPQATAPDRRGCSYNRHPVESVLQLI
jgi:hypothetical protein